MGSQLLLDVGLGDVARGATVARSSLRAVRRRPAALPVSSLLSPGADAALAAVPAPQVAWARSAWAVHHMTVEAIAEVLCVQASVVDLLLSAGRADRAPTGSVYDRLPWPDDAMAVLQTAAASGVQRPRAVGEKNPRAKLTAQQVLEIRCAVVYDGESVASVAEALGLHHSSVQDLCRGITWRHVGGPLLGASQEADEPIDTGTGRLQRLDASGAVLGTWPSVRAAEVATGVPRELIAAAANRGQGEWRYEPGRREPSALDAPTDEYDEEAGGFAHQPWAPLSGAGSTFEAMVRSRRVRVLAAKGGRPADGGE